MAGGRDAGRHASSPFSTALSRRHALLLKLLIAPWLRKLLSPLQRQHQQHGQQNQQQHDQQQQSAQRRRGLQQISFDEKRRATQYFQGYTWALSLAERKQGLAYTGANERLRVVLDRYRRGAAPACALAASLPACRPAAGAREPPPRSRRRPQASR